MQAVRRVASSLNPVRARAKVLSRETREMRESLIALRRANGMTQKDVADLLGVSQQAVYKLERYDADLRLSTLERYANAVGALVYHRVEADRGQSINLAAAPTWRSPRAATVAPVRPVSPAHVRSVEGWQPTATRAPQEIQAS
ncbi:MAG: helix-turn-helix transcriptional regulator [Microbacterium sp.]|nr:helix-turn-helix transcriptional regulator [Microbacterium sp.]